VSGPQLDLRAVLESLHAHGVDFVLFGSAAMLFYGYVRNTEDIDIVVRGGEENLGRRSSCSTGSTTSRVALRCYY
jgi:hypothetical protein